MSPWVFDPDSGGTKIPDRVKREVKQRIIAYAEKHYQGKYIRLDIRFRSQFCYIDAYIEPDVAPNWPPPDYPESREEFIERLRNTPTHLCRLRYFRDEKWSFAFYAYSSEKYKLCMFANGTFLGTPEEAFEQSAMYLQ